MKKKVPTLPIPNAKQPPFPSPHGRFRGAGSPLHGPDFTYNPRKHPSSQRPTSPSLPYPHSSPQHSPAAPVSSLPPDTIVAFKNLLFQALDYSPSPEQSAFHNSTARFRLLAGGERAGKSFAAALDTLALALLNGYGDYWIIGPTYALSRAEFDYIADAAASLALPISFLYNPPNPALPRHLSIQFPNSPPINFFTRSARDPRRLAATPAHGILLAEAGQLPYTLFTKALGRLAQTRGFLTLAGTFETGFIWYRDLFKHWQPLASNPNSQYAAFSIPTWANRSLFPLGRNDPEILLLESSLPHNIFLERYGAIPASDHYLVFPEFNPQYHVSPIASFNPDLPTYIFVDPGYFPSAYAVVAAHFLPNPDGLPTILIFDLIYEHYHTTEQIIYSALSKQWWPTTREGVIDIAGTSHHAAKSHREIWHALTGIYLYANNVPILDGIEILRTFLSSPSPQSPRILFNPSLSPIFREFANYRKPTSSDGSIVSDLPIDRDNHALKAIAYGLFHYFPHPQAALKSRSHTPTLDPHSIFHGDNPTSYPRAQRWGRTLYDDDNLYIQTYNPDAILRKSKR